MEHEIIFEPSGKKIHVPEGESILEAARKLGLHFEAHCGGHGSCGKCLVIVSDSDNLSPLTEHEKKILNKEQNPRCRLACSTLITGPVCITIPDDSLISEKSILTQSKEIHFSPDPAVNNYFIDTSHASNHMLNKYTKKELINKLEKSYSLRNLDIDHSVELKLARIYPQANMGITFTVWEKHQIIDVEAGNVSRTLGLAIDIGTTTVVGYLTDLNTTETVAHAAITNPQVSYGADVMSRLSYSLKNKNTRKQIKKCIHDGISKIIEDICAKAQIIPENISDVTIVCNTAMHHLFLGLDTKSLAMAPFEPVFTSAYNVKAKQIGLHVNPFANVHFLPLKAGFVGSDNIGVLISTQPYESDDLTLIIDIGTNGEVAFGNKKMGITVCSTAAGSALEGAHIKFGMRAAPGAIESIKIDPDTYSVKYRTIDNEKPRGLCGTGIISAVAEMLRKKILLSNGRLNTEISHPGLKTTEDGSIFIVVEAENTFDHKDIIITQKDIRQVQLAKGALYAGAKILMKHAGVEKIDRILLAGAFGSYIDKNDALTIGLIPECSPDKVISIGNAAGLGARMALVNIKKRHEAVMVAEKTRYIDLGTDIDFEEIFIHATVFP